MTTVKTTITTIERGIRTTSKSRSCSPVEHVKHQLHAFVDHSNTEKLELGKLNNKMGTYLNKVKHLEQENTRLMRDINEMQNTWGEGTRQVREQFEQNLFDMRGRIDDVAHLKTIADVRYKRAQYENGQNQLQLEDLFRANENDREKLRNLERELCNLLENNDTMKKAVADEINDIEKYKEQRDNTWANLVALLDQLDDELFRRIAVEYNNQTLREHIEFIKQINERELIEMGQLSQVLPFNEQIEFYKDQLKRVIANIRRDYDQLNAEQSREMEEWMKTKKEELAQMYNEKDPLHDLELSMQLETMESLRDSYEMNVKELEDLKRYNEIMSKRLSAVEEHVEIERMHLNDTLADQNNETKRLNVELTNLLNDYNHLNANKATLEYEMQVYKRLLDSQLDRLCNEEVVAPPKPSVINQTLVVNQTFGGKVQNKKEKKGTIGIADASPDGKYIVIENTGLTGGPIDLSGWSIKRKVDSNLELEYVLPNGIILNDNKDVTIWAKAYDSQRNLRSDLVTDFENWGIGILTVSRLVDLNGEEKATFQQQITFGY